MALPLAELFSQARIIDGSLLHRAVLALSLLDRVFVQAPSEHAAGHNPSFSTSSGVWTLAPGVRGLSHGEAKWVRRQVDVPLPILITTKFAGASCCLKMGRSGLTITSCQDDQSGDIPYNSLAHCPLPIAHCPPKAQADNYRYGQLAD